MLTSKFSMTVVAKDPRAAGPSSAKGAPSLCEGSQGVRTHAARRLRG